MHLFFAGFLCFGILRLLKSCDFPRRVGAGASNGDSVVFLTVKKISLRDLVKSHALESSFSRQGIDVTKVTPVIPTILYEDFGAIFQVASARDNAPRYPFQSMAEDMQIRVVQRFVKWVVRVITLVGNSVIHSSSIQN